MIDRNVSSGLGRVWEGVGSSIERSHTEMRLRRDNNSCVSATPTENPTNGSWWMVHVLSTRQRQLTSAIPPTAVGGWFMSFLLNSATQTEESHQRQLVDGSCP